MLKIIIISLSLILINSSIPAWAETFTYDQVVEAIFKSEGGSKAQYLYGIRSIPYKTASEARQICLNSVRNSYKRWINAGKPKDFISYMGDRYCPPTAHSLNKNWVKNVNYYLRKGR